MDDLDHIHRIRIFNALGVGYKADGSRYNKR